MGMYGSTSYLAQHGRPQNQADLLNHRLIGFDESMAQRSDVQSLERRFKPENIIHRSNSFVGLYEAAAAGIGLAMVDCFLGDPAEDLERVLPQKLFHEMEVWLVTHAEIGRSARIRALFDHIAESFKTDEALFKGLAIAAAAA